MLYGACFLSDVYEKGYVRDIFSLHQYFIIENRSWRIQAETVASVALRYPAGRSLLSNRIPFILMG